MKQTVEEAAREHQTHFEICDAEGTISGFINGVHKQSYESFISGAEWQSKQSPWISVEDKLPSLNQKVIVYNGKQIYISHRTEKDYAKDANSFLYGLQTYNVVAWMPIPSFDERYYTPTGICWNELKRKEIEYEVYINYTYDSHDVIL